MTEYLSMLPSPLRISAVASVTFTQLVRMRLFVVLALFCLGFLGLQFLPFHEHLALEQAGTNQLELIKNVGMGCMQIFGLLFCIAATSLLIPRDAEDRILYTILCKPVPRFDYLAGKALGLLSLLFVMLLAMDGLMSLILWMRESAIAAELTSILLEQGHSDQAIEVMLEPLRGAGLSWDLQRGVMLMFLGFGVLTSLTLLISCFTSTTIVSMVLALGLYFVGMFQGQVFAALSAATGSVGTSPAAQDAAQVFSVLVPHFGLYTASDAVASGASLSWSMLGHIALLSGGYMLFHLLLASWIFSKKEF